MPDTHLRAAHNLPPLSLHVPEPRFRPGDTADFSDIAVPGVDAIARPSEAETPHAIRELAYGLVRVLHDDGRAGGSWNPALSTERKMAMLRTMMLTRAFDDRMFRAQRQGKTSFYMKSTGEEATSVATAMALNRDDMCFPSYRQQGILIARGHSLVAICSGGSCRSCIQHRTMGFSASRATLRPSSRKPLAGRWLRLRARITGLRPSGAVKDRRLRGISTAPLHLQRCIMRQ
jgi:hypothetical protein